ncbi:MAG: hypothetical protein KBG47_04490 [Bacteroidia bacterium]|jgi:hypothetical protein|nr:hypothetical protein [Sphingobacteriaceae bacterium]MBK7817239.1 hypothetical protein [Sphingobacteriaceae bacterium]MBP9068741.1 hypothetical protein [Bacteroidia bacterium]
MNSRFFILTILVCCNTTFAQLGIKRIDSLNAKMQSSIPVDLSYYGNARIQLKEGVTYLNCIILEVKPAWIVYKKRGVLHDQVTDKIKRIRFDEQPLILEFDEQYRGKLSFVYD